MNRRFLAKPGYPGAAFCEFTEDLLALPLQSTSVILIVAKPLQAFFFLLAVLQDLLNGFSIFSLQAVDQIQAFFHLGKIRLIKRKALQIVFHFPVEIIQKVVQFSQLTGQFF